MQEVWSQGTDRSDNGRGGAKFEQEGEGYSRQKGKALRLNCSGSIVRYRRNLMGVTAEVT